MPDTFTYDTFKYILNVADFPTADLHCRETEQCNNTTWSLHRRPMKRGETRVGEKHWGFSVEEWREWHLCSHHFLLPSSPSRTLWLIYQLNVSTTQQNECLWSSSTFDPSSICILQTNKQKSISLCVSSSAPLLTCHHKESHSNPIIWWEGTHLRETQHKTKQWQIVSPNLFSQVIH